MAWLKLSADGGDMTVGRRTASYAWGSWSVKLKSGDEQVETDDRVSPGYIYKLPEPGGGLFDRTFVRSDASMDLEEGTSTVESNLESAEKRVEGDVFFERDISDSGLGIAKPGRDFNVNDLVDVLIWGKYLTVPVTSISLESSVGREQKTTVHVGGQVLQDAQALSTKNSEVLKQVASERKKAQADLNIKIKAASDKAETAQTTADTAKNDAATAQETADSAKEDAAKAQETADGASDGVDGLTTRLGKIDTLIQEAKDAAANAQGDADSIQKSWDLLNTVSEALVKQEMTTEELRLYLDNLRKNPDFVMSQEYLITADLLWKNAQEEINRAQVERDTQQDIIIKALNDALEERSKRSTNGVIFTKSSVPEIEMDTFIEDGKVGASYKNSSFYFPSDFVGRGLITYYDNEKALNHRSILIPDDTELIDLNGENVRRYKATMGGLLTSAVLVWERLPQKYATHIMSQPKEVVLETKTWGDIPGMSFKNDGNKTVRDIVVDAKFYFKQADWWEDYGIRIIKRSKGQEVEIKKLLEYHVGPLFGDDRRSRRLSINGEDLKPGEEIVIQGYSSHKSKPQNRTVVDGTGSVGFIK